MFTVSDFSENARRLRKHPMYLKSRRLDENEEIIPLILHNLFVAEK